MAVQFLARAHNSLSNPVKRFWAFSKTLRELKGVETVGEIESETGFLNSSSLSSLPLFLALVFSLCVCWAVRHVIDSASCLHLSPSLCLGCKHACFNTLDISPNSCGHHYWDPLVPISCLIFHSQPAAVLKKRNNFKWAVRSCDELLHYSSGWGEEGTNLNEAQPENLHFPVTCIRLNCSQWCFVNGSTHTQLVGVSWLCRQKGE